MHRPLCLIHANCQGDELESLLLASSTFRRAYRLERYTNYTRESVPAASLAECAVFLHQHLGAEWGELSSDALLARLPKNTTSLCLPSLFFNGSWPLWTSDSPIDFGDSLLDRLIDEGVEKSVILSVYLNKDLSSFIDLQATLDLCIAREREKERYTTLPAVDWIVEHWKERSLFHTVNHPGKELMLRITQGVLGALDMPLLTPEEFASLPTLFPSYAEFDLPVHPQVAAFHGLRWVVRGQTYRVFGRRMTFEQYVSRYIDCRLNGFADTFLAYLQLV